MVQYKYSQYLQKIDDKQIYRVNNCLGLVSNPGGVNLTRRAVPDDCMVTFESGVCNSVQWIKTQQDQSI